MAIQIKRAAVLGAGVMGAQIAAHLSACGIRTYLLDLPMQESDVPNDPKIKAALGKKFRNGRVLLALENLKSLKPSPLVSKTTLDSIIPGNFEDDWSVLAECDWIIEAVVERLDIKKSVHKRIAEVARPEVPVSTNTSGIALAKIAEDLHEHQQARLSGVHFFNPPRYMRLVEVIPHRSSDEQLVRDLAAFVHERLGKGVVFANDTINFIANRIGVLATQASIRHMNELGLNIETVDALTGPLIGRPKSATFRTMDVVGLDVFAHVAGNVEKHVPNDPFYDYFKMPAWVKKLIETGRLGQKSKGVGCFTKDKTSGPKGEILVYNPEKDSYGAPQVELPSWMDAHKKKDIFTRMRDIFAENDKFAEFMWRIHRDVFVYSAKLVEEISSGHPLAIDQALMWGFNWEVGPFALWQGIGFAEVKARIEKDGMKLPSWAEQSPEFFTPAPGKANWSYETLTHEFQLSTLQSRNLEKPSYAHRLPQRSGTQDPRIVLGNEAASLVDLGDRVGCLVFHSKMNTVGSDTLKIILEGVAVSEKKFDALVVGNEAVNFSAGANLAMVQKLIEEKNFEGIDQMIRQFQGATQMLKFCNIPVVAAPRGLTLGGGAEIALHCDEQLLAFETYSGLVEVGVGLIPAGGGTKELALRAYDFASKGERADPMPFLQRAFSLIGMGQVSSSGQDAIEMGLYDVKARAVPSLDHQIERAKRAALYRAELGYSAPLPRQSIAVVGDPGFQTFRMALHVMRESKQISEYDQHVGESVARILCGGEVDGGSKVSEQYLLELERVAFVDLCRQEKTVARISHMLKSGKPLRN